MKQIKERMKLIVGRIFARSIPIKWIQREEGHWLTKHFPDNAVRLKTGPYGSQIEKLAMRTNSLGAQPLWDGYERKSTSEQPTRTPDRVRTDALMGEFYTRLAETFKPDTVVEFGSAFGVSGMYFLAGLEMSGGGQLLTFEPNRVWADIARNNLKQISDRFKLTVGTFEENICKVMDSGQSIDLALIDAIHTSKFVLPQLEMVVKKSRPGTIILLDDINFSEDMATCWKAIATDGRFCASAELGGRVGLLELRGMLL